ncbi:MAG: type IV pili methyl-accepting chemotaxis transducer N-terminal domain-containing protein [Desulfotomaculales bacterium]
MSIRWKFVLPIVLIIFITAGQLYLVQSMNRAQQEDTVRVNLAGGQRMLSQKMTKETFDYLLTKDFQLASAQKETIDLFEQSLQALINGGRVVVSGSEVQVRPPASSEITAALNEAKTYWESVKPLFADAVRSGQDLPRERLVMLNDASVQLLARFDRITGMFETASSATVRQNMALIYAGLVLYLLLAVAVWLLANRNIIRPIVLLRDAANKIAAGDLS